MAELKDIIKSLAQQCNIESITTKDLAKELGTLYSSVEKLEGDVKSEKEWRNRVEKQLSDANSELAKYKETHVIPYDKLLADRNAFEKEKFKFEVEKEYVKKETDIYKELTRSMVASIARSEYYSSPNGNNWNKSEQVDKPMLPNTGTQVKMP
jgi:hypothetical protein